MFRCVSTTCDTVITASKVLSQENRRRTIDALKSFKPITTGKLISKRRAAVLVPLCNVDGNLSILLTIRSMRLRSNRGQVAYPGGMEDLDDKTLKNTVLRETEEEIGLNRRSIDIWGTGPSIGREEMLVTPYLAYVGELKLTEMKINKYEVEKVFSVPLTTFCNTKNFKMTHFRSRHGDYLLPVFATSTFRMWGLTALITHTILTALLPSQYHNKVQRQVVISENLPSTPLGCFCLRLPDILSCGVGYFIENLKITQLICLCLLLIYLLFYMY